MTKIHVSNGVVHDVPADLYDALTPDKKALEVWESLTPLARNEWICWTTFPKKVETRNEHVKRVVSELKEGMRRPCCWIGCIHRTDKAISPSVQGILSKKVRGMDADLAAAQREDEKLMPQIHKSLKEIRKQLWADK